MNATEAFRIDLPPHVLARLHALVEQGRYMTLQDAIADILAAWDLAETEREADVERLARLWDEGIRSGEPLDGEEVFAELLREFAFPATP